MYAAVVQWLSWLPGGSDAYDATLRYYTTTEKTAQEIHEIGLAQVAKLADEYRALGPEVVGTDGIDVDWLARVRAALEPLGVTDVDVSAASLEAAFLALTADNEPIGAAR